MAEKFPVSWLDKLQTTEDVAVRDTGAMGWRYEQGQPVGFASGNTFFHENGADIPMAASADNDFRSWYTPVGNREAWLDACKLLTDRKRPELDIIIATAFAAPLMTFAGALYGAIISVWGPPGTAKSTAQQVAAAVWGHPKQTRESLTSTPKSVQGRLGRCRNLCAYWDDIQDERHQTGLFNTMFVASQGAEGGRLTTSSGMKERLDWQTLLVACSNESFVDYLIHKQKSATAGLRRVFEIEIRKKNDPGMINFTDAGRVFGALQRNYGVIGAEYARMLAGQHKEIDLMVAGITRAFCEDVKGTVDEAYWWGSCGALLAGANLARKLGADLDVEAMREFLKHAFQYNRMIRSTNIRAGGSYLNAERALVEFVNHYIKAGNLLVVDRFGEHPFGRGRPCWDVTVLCEPGKDCPVVVQIVRDHRMILLSKNELRQFLLRKALEPRVVFKGLTKYFKAVERRHNLGSGTEFSQRRQETCYDIFIPENRPHVLLDRLLDYGPPKEQHLYRQTRLSAAKMARRSP